MEQITTIDLIGWSVLLTVFGYCFAAYHVDWLHDWHVYSLASSGLRRRSRLMRQKGIPVGLPEAQAVLIGIHAKAFMAFRTTRWIEPLRHELSYAIAPRSK